MDGKNQGAGCMSRDISVGSEHAYKIVSNNESPQNDISSSESKSFLLSSLRNKAEIYKDFDK